MFASKAKKEREKLKAEYEAVLSEQKDRIAELTAENLNLKAKLAKSEENRENVTRSLEAATQKAEEVRSVANAEYVLEIKRLKMFSAKWENYFNSVLKKTALTEDLKQTDALIRTMNAIIADDASIEYKLTPKQKVEKLRNLFEEHKKNNTAKSDAKDLSVSESGFDLNEVLNPSEDLNLFELCKELGVVEG